MQNFDSARRVVVLVEGDDGMQDGWEVFEVERCGWDWRGVGGSGTRATITVTGSFHRIRKDPNDPFQQAFDQAAEQLDEGPRQIGGPDGG